jgi:hypothetical protein
MEIRLILLGIEFKSDDALQTESWLQDRCIRHHTVLSLTLWRRNFL